jgi:hypothetical protein
MSNSDYLSQKKIPDSLHAFQEKFHHASPFVSGINGELERRLRVEGSWNKGVWAGRVVNHSDVEIAVSEVVLFEGEHGFSAETPIYGESFQMLAQITGTLGEPEDLGPTSAAGWRSAARQSLCDNSGKSSSSRQNHFRTRPRSPRARLPAAACGRDSGAAVVRTRWARFRAAGEKPAKSR